MITIMEGQKERDKKGTSLPTSKNASEIIGLTHRNAKSFQLEHSYSRHQLNQGELSLRSDLKGA